MASYRSGSPQAADIVTYRMGDTLVYVKPTLDYEEAIDVAVKEFPEQLTHVPRHRIAFMLQATMGGSKRTVRVSESAWPSTICRLVRAEVIDIVVVEDRKSSPPPSDAPPQYLEVPGPSDAIDEKRSLHTKSRSPSPSGRRSPSGLSWFSRK